MGLYYTLVQFGRQALFIIERREKIIFRILEIILIYPPFIFKLLHLAYLTTSQPNHFL